MNDYPSFAPDHKTEEDELLHASELDDDGEFYSPPASPQQGKKLAVFALMVGVAGVVGVSAYALTGKSFDLRQQASWGNIGPCQPDEYLKKGVCIPRKTATPAVPFQFSPRPAVTPTPSSETKATPGPVHSPLPPVSQNVAPKIVTRILPTAYAGRQYSATIEVSDRNVPETLTVTVKNLPDGLSVAPCSTSEKDGKTVSTCKIYGIVAMNRRFNQVTIEVKDSKGLSSYKKLPLTVGLTIKEQIRPTMEPIPFPIE